MYLRKESFQILKKTTDHFLRSEIVIFIDRNSRNVFMQACDCFPVVRDRVRLDRWSETILCERIWASSFYRIVFNCSVYSPGRLAGEIFTNTELRIFAWLSIMRIVQYSFGMGTLLFLNEYSLDFYYCLFI